MSSLADASNPSLLSPENLSVVRATAPVVAAHADQQSLGHSIELCRRPSYRVAGRTRGWWGAAGSGEGYLWNCRTSVKGRKGVGEVVVRLRRV